MSDVIIPFPREALQVTEVTFEMGQDHGYQRSPFTGLGCVHRGQREQWICSMRFQNVSESLRRVVEGFFMRLEGQANLFAMTPPCGRVPKGDVYEALSLAELVTEGDRTVKIAGLLDQRIGALVIGDWLQIGKQLTKIRKVSAPVNGVLEVEVWPKIWNAYAAGETVIWNAPVGLWRYTTEAPSWSMSGYYRPFSTVLTGMQEIVVE